MSNWREELKRLPRLGIDFELEPSKCALLIVDMTYFDAHPDYGMGPMAHKLYPEVARYYYGRLANVVVPNHKKLLRFFRQNRLRVIYLTVGPALPDKSDLSPLLGRLKKAMSPVGSFEHGVLEDIKPQEGELVLNKTSSGAFNSTDLEHTLRNLSATTLIITGCSTPFCVETTARDAADRGFNVVLVDDACAAQTEELHDASLRAFAMFFGKVMDTEEIIGALKG